MQRTGSRHPRIRVSTAADVPALGASGFRAFRHGDVDGWTNYFAKHSHLTPRDTWIEEAQGEIRGHVSALRFQMALGGGDVDMRGYAAVAVAPEHRRTGVADRLMRPSLRALRREHVPLTMLYPFSVPYYARFGFARCEFVEEILATPASFPASALRSHVRRWVPERHGREVRALYESWRRDRCGPFARKDWWWNERIPKRAPDGAIFIEPGTDRVTGYMLYDVPVDATYGSQQLVVRELVATTPGATRGLWGFLAAFGEQMGRVAILVPSGELPSFLTGYGDGHGFARFGFVHTLGSVGGGAMARILDVRAAVAAHPGASRVRGDGAVTLNVRDPLDESPAKAWTLEAHASRGVDARAAGAKRPTLRVDIGALSQIYVGAVRAVDLWSSGCVEGDRAAAEQLDQWFAGPRPFLCALNGF